MNEFTGALELGPLEGIMGSIYRPKYTDRHGAERESAVWWIQYYSHGHKIRESTETADHAEAKDFLKRKEGDATKGRITKSTERKVLYSELAELVENDYEINGFRSLVDIELRHRLHILPYFGKVKAVRIGEADIGRYILHRKGEKASNATVNRELANIKRAFTLGIQKKLVSDRPHISMLEEDNVRQGFFEREQYEAVRAHLPEHVQPVADFAYVTGWRRSEILSLQWRQVDFKAGNVRLEAGTTKNKEARQVSLHRGAARGPGGPEGRGRHVSQEWEDMPVGLPAQRQANRGIQAVLEDGLHQSWIAWTPDA